LLVCCDRLDIGAYVFGREAYDVITFTTDSVAIHFLEGDTFLTATLVSATSNYTPVYSQNLQDLVKKCLHTNPAYLPNIA
jgi:hypothetical protein